MPVSWAPALLPLSVSPDHPRPQEPFGGTFRKTHREVFPQSSYSNAFKALLQQRRRFMEPISVPCGFRGLLEGSL